MKTIDSLNNESEACATRREKRLDSAARRAANRQGLVACKNRGALSLENHGAFMIIEPTTGIPCAGFQYDLSAEAVIEWCREQEWGD